MVTYFWTFAVFCVIVNAQEGINLKPGKMQMNLHRIASPTITIP